ncbi:uncharacterized protein [Halyomorpha halys]|uniref:uncharacterized protein n=1 Tax=Halyomorpha halys TaxID=286706 RepID=UPI0006D50A53|nr:uncharacterized protein LOC106684946 [Halyomorpha halys]XP_014282829.1 uncharacterized protein LOC106684946 [Halyomorpha halys]
MENENLIGVYLKLLSVLECPVCLEYLTKPVALCNGGHALCSKCKSSITSCPLCRNPISSTRGLILDQIIETLLYPCYKLGCGSLLKRKDAETHDLNCALENATDKQAVLHNNLLKNIEENFGSFIVQPEVVKETRTVGTVTGKVKTADARVQTAIPFSSSFVIEKMNSSTSPAGSSSGLSGLVKTKKGLTTGISISSMDHSPTTGFQTADLSSLAFSFPATSSIEQNAISFSMTPDGLNNANMSSLYSLPQDSSSRFAFEPFKNISSFSRNTAGNDPNSKPFVFTSGTETNSGNTVTSSSRKPSTNLSFSMKSVPSAREGEPAISKDFFIRNQEVPFTNLGNMSSESIDISVRPSTSSSAGLLAPQVSRDDSNLPNKTFKKKPSTNLTSCSTSVNSVSGINSQPFVPSGAQRKKRPTTNLCGLTTSA